VFRYSDFVLLSTAVALKVQVFSSLYPLTWTQ